MRRVTQTTCLVLLLVVAAVMLVGCKGVYVGSKYTGTYHDPSCIWAEEMSSDSKVWFEDAAEAEAAGYVPCERCDPGSEEE